MRSRNIERRAILAILPTVGAAACVGADAQPSSTYRNQYFRGDQVETILRAWTAIRTEFNLSARLRDCLISYSGGGEYAATIHFAVRPDVINDRGEQHVGEVRYYVANVDGETIHVFREGQGEIVNVPP